MRRPPSYSDSFLVVPYRNKDLALNNTDYSESLLSVPPETETFSWTPAVILFLFKGSFHIFCISVFETTFYFLYVNHSEDAGILTTIDTYYKPLIENCNTRWTNVSRWIVKEFFIYAVNQTAVDSAGASASASRVAFNNTLILTSSLYSAVSLFVCAILFYTIKRAKWDIVWSTVLLENILFIIVLAAYEFFFYNTIIYKYITLSTPELNKYIVDGLAQCIV